MNECTLGAVLHRHCHICSDVQRIGKVLSALELHWLQNPWKEAEHMHEQCHHTEQLVNQAAY